uniref:RNA-directed DNA polymerase, eukaryota n=1 Tax=Tanacetum cinerariifolium TaxID=118510 RepID=A0A699HU30_TANCI|nr:RNA-directed DNA polymerase, eukaryota [Tanacetum cinerariifolium]
MHLHANVVLFERSPLQSSRAYQPIRPDKIAPSFVSAVKGFSVAPLSASPAMVLDDSCMVTRDLGNYVMGELVYLGGLWVMIELKSSKSNAKFLNHVGVASWFNCLSNAQSDFVSRDRIVWVDIEGVPMHAWSRNTLYKIGSKWGEVLELEECRDDFFARKRICIKTKQEDNILEKFKIIVKGKIFVVRAKELFVWSPTFKDVPEMTNLEDESDSEAVSDTYFGDNTNELGNVDDSVQPPIEKEISNDPFNIYDLLNKRDKEVDNTGTDSSIPFPPGFTPMKDIYKEAEQDMHADQVRGSDFKHSKDGSILVILDEMIKVGQTMRFSMDGCLGSKAKKEWIRELNIKYKFNFLTLHETKMDNISAMEVKFLWGNSNFKHLFSDAFGNYGGILCTWDPNVFHKEHHIISDNFVALHGTWISRLVDVQLEGYTFTWAHPSATKMSKLDSFLVTDGLLSLFPHVSAVCLDRHLLDHRHILLRENPITRDEIRNAVWGCGENKSPGPGGFTFEFFRCNSSFIALISKSLDPKSVSDYRPISLIGSLYKVATQILVTRLSKINSDLISDVQTAFLPNRQILDGPFIINELLARCHHNKQRAMVFKVDFAKANNSIRWDYLEDVLKSFGFGSKWCSWIHGSLHWGMAFILVNGSPTSEFQFHCGLKQGDRLASYLFILIMESLHLSFSRVIDAGIFTGVRIDYSLMISHLFYADDAVFIGEWSHDNLKGIMHMLHCFSLMSGLSINLKTSHLFGVGIPASCVHEAATSLGCSVMKALFKYLGIMVGGNMSLVKAWDDTVDKLKGRNLFNGIQELTASHSSTWSSILKEINILKAQGVDLISHCKICVGNGLSTSFLNDLWIGDAHLRYMFPHLYALDPNKECTVADKINAPLTSSFRRTVRGEAESLQLAHLLDLLGPVILSNMEDRWIWDMNGDDVFRVKDVRILLDEVFLPNDATPTRWIKSIPIKVNVFAWKVSLDRLPTRSNLSRRGVVVPSLSCPICNLIHEDTTHLLFSCGLAYEVMRLVCRWWIWCGFLLIPITIGFLGSSRFE